MSESSEHEKLKQQHKQAEGDMSMAQFRYDESCREGSPSQASYLRDLLEKVRAVQESEKALERFREERS